MRYGTLEHFFPARLALLLLADGGQLRALFRADLQVGQQKRDARKHEAAASAVEVDPRALGVLSRILLLDLDLGNLRLGVLGGARFNRKKLA